MRFLYHVVAFFVPNDDDNLNNHLRVLRGGLFGRRNDNFAADNRRVAVNSVRNSHTEGKRRNNRDDDAYVDAIWLFDGLNRSDDGVKRVYREHFGRYRHNRARF